MKNILKTYEDTIGQMINFQKSEVYFSKNASTTCKASITSILDVHVFGYRKISGASFDDWEE